MNIICSPMGIADPLFPGQGVLDIKRADFSSVTLDMRIFCTAYELEYPEATRRHAGTRKLVMDEPAVLQERVARFMSFVQNQNLDVRVAYAISLPRNARKVEDAALIQVLVKESVKAAVEVGCKYIVVRPLFVGIEREKSWEINRDFYLTLAELIKDTDMKILLENQCADKNGHLIRGICSDAIEAVNWLDALNAEATKRYGRETFGFYLDTGVCNLCSQDMNEFISILKDRIKAVVLRECDGHIETAMLPFTCVSYGASRTDWMGLIRGLRECGFDGELILEFADTAKAFSPILRPQLMTLAKSVADYFKWQIELENLLKRYNKIVLFGAGNMCRNYMKCYGTTYPPLFTCDNNGALWGSEFCGLEVKAPDSLKDLPSNCAIFICNVYYREIEKQIRDMGIENPIEFFNDEYLSTFFMDRIER